MPTVRALARRHFDDVLGVALAVLGAVEFVATDAAHPARALPLVILAGLGQTQRRRSPLAAALISLSALTLLAVWASRQWDDDSGSFFITIVVTLYGLGAYARGREMVIGALVVVAEIVRFIFDDGDRFHWGDIFFATLILGGPWATGLAIQLRRNQAKEMQATHERVLREQEEAARQAIATERATIARELHDVVSHAISVSVLQARGARRVIDADPDAVRRALDAIEQTNTAALSDMRRLLAVLRDVEDDPATADQPRDRSPAPSLGQLDTLVASVREAGVPVDLQVNGASTTVPPGVDLSAYRIVQEALTNVIKHAGPATATVRLDYSEDALQVAISDDGQGSGENTGIGHGLIGIRERAAVVGGTVTARPAAGGGFEVKVRLPYALELT